MTPLLREGQAIGTTYQVERKLGEGAFAEVYRVRHRFMGHQAMKVFKAVGMKIAEIERMLDEAVLLSRFGHPHIIRVYEANVTETSRGMCGFFTMDLVAGGTLELFWKGHGAQYVPAATAVEILAQVCEGLAVAHGQVPPIVHRDIKPDNILIGYGPDGLQARVTDFGLAKRVDIATMLVSAAGTLVFKGPEISAGKPSADSCAGDVWALGTTLYLLLTDQLPYPQAGDLTSRSRAFRTPHKPPSRLNIDVDARLDAIVGRALEPKPSKRYPHARAMLTDLRAWQSSPAGAVQPRHRGSESTSQKDIFGAALPTADEEFAREQVKKAIALSHQAGKLPEAADMMEEAFNRLPELRERHEARLQLWRRGIVG